MREGHLARELVRPAPRELLDVVGRVRLAVGGHPPREPEHEVVVVGLGVRPEPFDRLDFEPGLLTEFATKSVEWIFTLFEKPAGEVPIAAPGVDPSLRHEHLAVTLEHPLDRWRRVRVVDGPAGGTT